MKTLQAGLARLKRAGDLLSESTDISPKSGVWITHITRQAIAANIMLTVLLISCVALVWWASGRPPILWVALTLLVCAKAISLCGQAVALTLDTHPDRPPSSAVFLAWAALTALLGLPLGHWLLYLAPQVQPLALIPFFKRYFPECFLAAIIAVRYGRLVIVRLWFERLAAEKLKRQAAEQGRALAETRLHMLESRIEPQFLFNTLAGVQDLVRKDAAQADFLLVQLISYLRMAMPDVAGKASTLGREFDLVRTYLAIVQVRVGARLAVTADCDPALEQVAFPSLLLHALVENAVKHGVETTLGPVSIAIRARASSGALDISVADSGAGVAAALNQGDALRNIRERLALAYQGAARLGIADVAGGGVCVTVHLPPP